MNGLRVRQAAAVVAVDLRRRFLGKRAIPLYLLCLVPLVLFGTRAAVGLTLGIDDTLPKDRYVFAVLYRVLVLRFVVFFGCVAVFTSLFRGEILDRSLHYSLLAPMRREVLGIGKYLSGLATVLVLTLGTVTASWALLHLAHGTSVLLDAFLTGDGAAAIARYLGATALACAGYGALFLLVGILFRSPMIPALALLGWEGANFLLPPALKMLSVVHFVEGLLPVTVSEGPVAVLASPSSPWIAVPGVLLVSAGLVVLATRRLRRIEVLYGAE